MMTVLALFIKFQTCCAIYPFHSCLLFVGLVLSDEFAFSWSPCFILSMKPFGNTLKLFGLIYVLLVTVIKNLLEFDTANNANNYYYYYYTFLFSFRTKIFLL